MEDIVEKSSNGHKIGSVGAALAVLCFFLPWILVSCGGQTISLNGWQLAAGTNIGTGYVSQRLPGKPILFLALLGGLGALGLAYLAYRRGRLTEMDGYGLIGIGAVPLLVLLTYFSGSQQQVSQQGMHMEFRFGLAGVIIGYLGVIAGGVLNQRELAAPADQPDDGT